MLLFSLNYLPILLPLTFVNGRLDEMVTVCIPKVLNSSERPILSLVRVNEGHLGRQSDVISGILELAEF